MSLRIRRGGFAVDEDVPPSETYGPVAGAQTVRDNAGPRTVATPSSGVSFTSASNIQTLINANAANTVFIASGTGTYTNFRGIDWNDKHPRFYFPGAASSYNITGTGSGSQIGVGTDTSDATNTGEIHGGTWTAYGNSSSPLWMAAIYTISLIEDAVITANGQMGLHLRGTASHCTFSNNGRYGLSTGAGTGYILEYCIVDNNNVSHIDTEADAGGFKFTHQVGTIARYNWVKNNQARGMWWDGENESISCHDNVVENNVLDGIDFEIVNGGNIIEHNHTRNNGLGNAGYAPLNQGVNNANIAIYCSASDGTGIGGGPDVTSEVRYNYVDGGGLSNPIHFVDHSGHVASNKMRNWYAHHNQIWMRGTALQGRCGLWDLHHQNLIMQPAAQNHFDYNEYHVATAGGTYYEADGVYTFVQFQAQGQEANGTETAI